MLRRVLLLIALAIAPPAIAMPDTDALRALVEARIAEAAGPGLLEVTSFRRMGRAPDPAGGASIAYFAARLRLTRLQGAKIGSDRAPVSTMAFIRSMKKAPVSGTIRKATGAGPYRPTTACMLAMAVAVAPSEKP